jgi:hypothetical protein
MYKIVRVERDKAQQTEPQIANLFLGFAMFGSAILITLVATHPEFFLFNPFASGDTLRSICLSLTSIGWVTLTIGPILIFGLNAAEKPGALKFLPWVALAWPVSLVINHLALLVQTHKLYVGYLLVYPTFFITDICLPIAYLVIASYLKRSSRFSSVGLSHGKHQQEERS